MAQGYADRRLWLESYMEEIQGLRDNDTYTVINGKAYANNYSDVQVLPSMNVQTIKKDSEGLPIRVKSRIVALGNFEDTIWDKSDKFAPVLRDESSRLMTTMAIGIGRREKQGDCKNAFIQSRLPANEKIIVRPPKGCPSASPVICGSSARLYMVFDGAFITGITTSNVFSSVSD
jgi:hypothetical protein